MKFNKDNGNMNPNYETQVEARNEALKLIEEIDKNLDYVTDDLSEYKKIREHVKTFVPVERFEDKLPDEVQRKLEANYDRLVELVESLK